MLQNDFAFFEIMLAADLCRATFVPLNWHLTAAEIGYILRDYSARVLIVRADLLPVALAAADSSTQIAAVRPHIEPVKGAEMISLATFVPASAESKFLLSFTCVYTHMRRLWFGNHPGEHE